MFKCKICGNKSFLICKSCKKLLNENLKNIEILAEETYFGKYTIEDFHNFIKEFVLYYVPKRKFIKLNYFDNVSLDYYLENLFKVLWEKQIFKDNNDYVKLLKIFDIKLNPIYEFNYKIDENFQNYKELYLQKTKEILDDYLNDNISLKDFKDLFDYYSYSLDTDNKNENFEALLSNKALHILDDFIIEKDEKTQLEKIFLCSNNIKNLILSSTIYNMSTTLTKIINNDFINNKEYYQLNNEFAVSHKNIIYYYEQTNFYKTIKTRQYRSNGVGLSIKICNGVYLRPSSFTTTPYDNYELKNIGEGNFYISNDSIIFSSNVFNKEIKMSKLQNLICYSNGIEFIYSNRDKPIFLNLKYPKYVYSLLLYLKGIKND